MGKMYDGEIYEKVSQWFDGHREEMTEDIKRLVRIPSISDPEAEQGPAWWWCDHLYGMREVFENLASFGVLSVFVGMTTDSRSILSFVRHEYFRRAFCGWLGEKAEKGEWDVSEAQLKKLVEDVCYFNAKMLGAKAL